MRKDLEVNSLGDELKNTDIQHMGEVVQIPRSELREVSLLKEQIQQQASNMQEITEKIVAQATKLEELTPENTILKRWVGRLTHYSKQEVDEIVRMEKFFPGTIEHGLKRADGLYDGNSQFIDFIEGAKEVALILLQGKIADEQIELLKKVQLDPSKPNWGRICEYTHDDIVLLPDFLQELFATYLFKGSIESEEKFIRNAKLAYSLKNAKNL